MILVPASDTHVNSTVGLWPPDFIGKDGTPKPQNKFQKWLWACWLDYCAWVEGFGERIVIHNGDSVQGINPSKDIQLMSLSADDQTQAAKLVLAPLFDAEGVVAKYFVKGTEWHEGAGGDEIEGLAREMHAKVNAPVGQYTHWLLRIRLDGKLFVFAHHSSMTTVYHHTPAQRAMREAKEAFVDGGLEVADCFVRSHVHRFGITPDETGERFYITTPGWQLKNAHAYKFRPDIPPVIGGIVLWVEDNQIKYRKRTYSLRLDPAEEYRSQAQENALSPDLISRWRSLLPNCPSSPRSRPPAPKGTRRKNSARR